MVLMLIGFNRRTLVEVPNIKNVFKVDISDLDQNIGKYDAIFMSGVHSIFDNFNCILSVKSLLKDKNSKAYVFGLWNP